MEIKNCSEMEVMLELGRKGIYIFDQMWHLSSSKKQSSGYFRLLLYIKPMNESV